MDFTVITPSLNYGRFLGDCLQSVADQAGVEVEHLIIDGGSTDESREVAQRYPHADFTSEPDQGMSDAINKGFNRARGKWVMWLNADDRLKPGILAAVMKRLDEAQADLVYGDWDLIDGDGRLLRRIRVPKWSRFVHVHHHCFIGSTAAFLRKSSVMDGGHRLSTDFRYVMDGEFYVRLSDAGLSFQKIPLTVADFRMHGDNLSQKHLGRSREVTKALGAELQFAESRAIRRAYGITLFEDPYLNGLVDGVLWILAKAWKGILRLFS